MLLGGALAGGAAAQQILVQGRGEGAPASAPHELEVHVTTERGDTRHKVKGKRIELIVEARVDTARWEARLTDPDIDARELAFEELVAAARKDTGLGLAIQTWSMNHEKPELAWSARLALRELRNQNRPRALAWVPRIDPGDASQVEARASQPAVQEGSRSVPLPQQLRDLNPGGVLPLAGRRMLSLAAPRILGLPENPTGILQPRGRVQLQVQPEGVTLVMTEIRNGQVRERRYAAESIEALLAEHPHLRGQVATLGRIQTHQLAQRMAAGKDPSRLSGNPWSLRSLDPSTGAFQIIGGNQAPGSASANPGGPDVRILGVKVTTLSTSEAERRLLGPGVGLLIERREPGSVAEALDLKRGDVLLELLGQQLCNAEEITRLLHENSSEEITVKLLDRNGIERVRTWKPAKR